MKIVQHEKRCNMELVQHHKLEHVKSATQET